MKTPKSLYSRLALITSVTLVMGYVLVYAWYAIPDVNTGDTLSKDPINHMLSNITELKTSVDSKISSQWNTSGSDINYTAGKVGIGTASPLALLEVNSWAILRFMDYGSLQLDKVDLNDTSPALKIQNTAGTQFLRVQHNGNIGIGTGSPSVKLDVSGQMRVYWNSSQITTTGTNGSDAQIYMVTDANARGFYLDNDDANKLKIFTGYWKGVVWKEVTFDNEGNVGIGTVGPLDKLDLNGVLRIWHDGTNRGRIYVSSNCTGDATLGIDNGRYLCFQGL